jgi:hypothetical protein
VCGEEDFYQISVDVKGMGSLQKSLDDYVKVRQQIQFGLVFAFLVPDVCVWQEDLYQISVDVKGMGSLQKSLDDYVKVCNFIN